jgi:hypothetical protein
MQIGLGRRFLQSPRAYLIIRNAIHLTSSRNITRVIIGPLKNTLIELLIYSLTKKSEFSASDMLNKNLWCIDLE